MRLKLPSAPMKEMPSMYRVGKAHNARKSNEAMASMTVRAEGQTTTRRVTAAVAALAIAESRILKSEDCLQSARHVLDAISRFAIVERHRLQRRNGGHVLRRLDAFVQGNLHRL